MRSLMLSLSLFSLPLLGQFRAPENLGSLAVLNMPDGFAVIKDGKINPIESDCVDITLRKMDYKQRALYLSKGGSIELNQADNGEFTLKSVANLKGGGPVMAAALYWITKVSCYTGVAISATAVVAGAAASAVATGGATVAPTVTIIGGTAGLAIKGAVGIAAANVAAPVTIVITGPIVANAAALGAAGVMSAAGTAGATAVATTVAAANTGTVALAAGVAGKVGLAAGIEAASCNAFALGMLFPWF
jgi:hypothetical protein